MIVFRVGDELGVRAPDGHLDHGTVDEAGRIVLVALDNAMLPVAFDPADNRLQPWPVTA